MPSQVLKQILRDKGVTDKSFERCDQKDELLALLNANGLDDGHCDAISTTSSFGTGFHRPFKLFTDHEIMNFLDLNEIPSEIDDVRVLRYINDHERLVKGLFLPFLFDQRVTIFFFRYHSMCAARLHRHCLFIYVDLTLAQVLFADLHHTGRRCGSLRKRHRRAHRTSLLASVFDRSLLCAVRIAQQLPK